MMIKATKVDGVYDKDPVKYADAKKYSTLDYDTVIQKELAILDTMSVVLAKQGKLPIHVLALDDSKGLQECISGHNPGTTIS